MIKIKEKSTMSKTIMIDDSTYAKLKKKAKAEDRSISKMAKILISKALDSEERAATPDMSPYAPIDWGSESEPEVERKPVRRAEVKDLTLEEMRQMQQRTKNKAPNWAMSEEE